MVLAALTAVIVFCSLASAERACSAAETCSAEEKVMEVTKANSLLQLSSAKGLQRAVPAEEEDTNVHQHADLLQKNDADGSDTTFSSRLRVHVAYASFLRRATDTLEVSRNASNQELDKLVDKFITAHVTSKEECPSQLLEAKHQLNNLHKAITDLSETVKSTEGEIRGYEEKKEEEMNKLSDVEKKYQAALAKIAVEKNESRKFLTQLQSEMKELKAIAQPGVTMDISTGKVNSLLDMPPAAGADAQDAQMLVQKTKAASEDLAGCMQGSTGDAHAALVQAPIRLAHARTARHLSSAAAHRSAHRKNQATTTAPKAVPADAANCSVNTSTQATLGTSTTQFLSPVAIAHQGVRSYECEKVDSGYSGTVWVHCSDGVVTADASGCLKGANKTICEDQLKYLQSTYVRAYVALNRLIDENEAKVTSTAAEDAAKNEHDDKADPIRAEMAPLANKIAASTRSMQDLRSKLDDAWKGEKKLQDHVSNTASQCQQLGTTTQYLADVRKAIHALEACPGLQRAEFHIPLFAGEWANFTLDPTKTDAENDAAMSQACEAKFGSGSRAAEVSEIERQSIEGMPINNTAAIPLLGKCPGCEGGSNSNTGSTSVTGHARICWLPGKSLDVPNRANICFQDMKAVLCVSDRGDVRKLAGFFTTAAPP